MKFEDLNLIAPILRTLKNKGYTAPTPIQQKAIPVILQGKDLLGCAQTGTGKTAAFAIPILQILHEKQTLGNWPPGIKTLVITPTRELAIQIDESFGAYGEGSRLRHTVVFGGVKQHAQVRKIRAGVDILVATPGRLLDLMNQGIVDLRHLKFFVLDEADRMLDMGFIHDIKKIVAKLPPRRQSLFFSATMPPDITTLANSLLTNPVRVEVSPVSSAAETVEQKMYHVAKANKKSLLTHMLKNENIPSALVFTRTKYGADKVARFIKNAGIHAEAIHGNKSQNARQMALKNFKNKSTKVLVATDIAARGIDIDELSHVINFEIPNEPEAYVHRIGRTGRAEKTGIALSFCDQDEKKHVKNIHKLLKKEIPVERRHPFSISPFDAVEKKKSGNQDRARRPQKKQIWHRRKG
ncbi:MAG: DEAD/DEAH box helicase [Candidatus Gracilibacteria bacterium]|nr:DEAD/DEAH box helicase [Candidatus Gracilibacteria bacterium]